LRRGADIIQSLFPELTTDAAMARSGAMPIDVTRDLRWFHFGVWKRRFTAGLVIYLCNRLKLEHTIRSLVRRIDNVEFLSAHEATALCTNENRSRVTGVTVVERKSGVGYDLEADFVVDTSGRGSRTPRWLDSLGYDRPQESEIKVQVGYASRIYRLQAGFDDHELPMALFPHPPHTRRLGVMYRLDERTLMLTLAGWCRDHPPRQDKGFLRFADSLEGGDFAGLLTKDARPAPIHTHLFPSSLRRHYDQMPSWPDGFVVLGDAVCSFNPIYGQGMTVCAIEANILAHALYKLGRRGKRPQQPGVARTIQKRFARALFTPWLMVRCEDLRFGDIPGPRPWWLRPVQWYIAEVLKAAETHRLPYLRFVEVLCFVRSPAALAHPVILGIVLWRVLKQLLPSPAKTAPSELE
ncbi:MAG: NAD(P)/FAD-dependent oxidoreductase, partial [Nannocystaceae bacterium]